MSKTFETEKHIFEYEIINNAFVSIIGYKNPDGKITFSKSDENEYTYVIDVPQSIEDLPVFYVAPFYVDMETEGINGYRNNGSTVIVLNLPQHTIFSGFGKFYTSGGYLYPTYKIQYYKRKDCDLLLFDDGDSSFFARPLDSATCEIIMIGKSHWHSNENVWDKPQKKNHTYIDVPGYIAEHKVVALAPDCTPCLPKTIATIKLADEIERIGCNCFNNLPKLTDLYLGKNLLYIEDKCFCFHEETREEYLKKIPQLKVHYFTIPQKSDKAFVRGATALIGEDYSDWGWMKTGTEELTYQVSFIPIQSNKDFEIDGKTLVKCHSKVSQISVPEGISVIGASAFENNVFVQKVILPEGVERIGARAFFNCQKLKEIIIPQSVIQFEYAAFANCPELTSIELPENTECIGKGVFSGCQKLEKIKIPNNIKSIEGYVFENCGIRESEIPESVKIIETYAFKDCTSLETICFKGAVDEIEHLAFDNCPNIKNIIALSPFEGFRSKFKTKNILNIYIEDISALCAAKSSCIDAPYLLYVKNEEISDLVIPSDCTKIEEAVFANCKNLRSVTIPAQVTEIGEEAFYKCDILESVVFNDGLKIIGKRAFQNCGKLTSIFLPESVSQVGLYAFGWCENLDSVHITDIEEFCRTEFGDFEKFGFKYKYSSPFKKHYSLYLNGEIVKELTIPETVSEIGMGAFGMCKSITKLTIQEGVKIIKNYAFSNCPELRAVVLPKSVEEIYSGAFETENDLVIYAPSGSYAEEWAKMNNIKFVAQ